VIRWGFGVTRGVPYFIHQWMGSTELKNVSFAQKDEFQRTSLFGTNPGDTESEIETEGETFANMNPVFAFLHLVSIDRVSDTLYNLSPIATFHITSLQAGDMIISPFLKGHCHVIIVA
jgi:hypothetical protein